MAQPSAFAVLRMHNVRLGLADRVEAVRFVASRAAAEDAVRLLNDANQDESFEYGWQPAVVQPDGSSAFGISLRDASDDATPWRDRVLPVNVQQSCAACDSFDWAWLFPLEPLSRRAFTFGYFLCGCEQHYDELKSQDVSRVASAFRYMADGDPLDARRYADAFLEERVGAPLTRREATAG